MQKFSDAVFVTDVPGGQVRAPYNATVQINVSGGGIATIYSDNGVTLQTNPIVCDSSGEYSFYAANGLYDKVTAVPGFTTETQTASIMLFDSVNSPTLPSLSVGTLAASGNITVTLADAAGAAPSLNGIRLENNGSAYLQIITPSANESGVIFGDTNAIAASIIYQHSTDAMNFNGAGTGAQLMSLTSTGLAVTGTLTASGQVLAATQSPTTPSYSFSGFTGTGFYPANANDVRLCFGGNQRIFFQNGGIFPDTDNTLSLGTTGARWATIGSPILDSFSGSLVLKGAGTTAITITGANAGLGGAASSTSTALNLPASTTAVSSIRLAHGVAPTSPVNGEMWTTTAGLFVRINGATVGPLT